MINSNTYLVKKANWLKKSFFHQFLNWPKSYYFILLVSVLVITAAGISGFFFGRTPAVGILLLVGGIIEILGTNLVYMRNIWGAIWWFIGTIPIGIAYFITGDWGLVIVNFGIYFFLDLVAIIRWDKVIDKEDKVDSRTFTIYHYLGLFALTLLLATGVSMILRYVPNSLYEPIATEFNVFYTMNALFATLMFVGRFHYSYFQYVFGNALIMCYYFYNLIVPGDLTYLASLATSLMYFLTEILAFYVWHENYRTKKISEANGEKEKSLLDLVSGLKLFVFIENDYKFYDTNNSKYGLKTNKGKWIWKGDLVGLNQSNLNNKNR